MPTVSDKLRKFAAQALFETIKKGGKLATKEHAEARLDICRNCPLLGEVEPLPGLVVEGCTACGCPSATKPYMLTYFSPSKLSVTNTECAHPDGNQWKDIDHQFNDSYHE